MIRPRARQRARQARRDAAADVAAIAAMIAFTYGGLLLAFALDAGPIVGP
jgi:hypothetical protein